METSVTVAEVRELFAYNAWANRRCFAALEPVPVEAYVRDLKSSHGGLHGTLCHIVWAEQLWLNRWLGKPNPAVPQGRDLASLAAARTRLGPFEPGPPRSPAGPAGGRSGEPWPESPSTGGEDVSTFP